MDLRQSTASQEILLGRFVDSTDGDTEETALTINNTDIKIWKEGATTLANKNSGGATHISNGLYYAVLDATDTDTLGKMEVHVHVAGALAVKREYMVLPANVYDSLHLGTDKLDVNTAEVGGQTASASGTVTFPNATLASTTNITAGTIATVTNVTTVNGLAANVITATSIAADAITAAKIADNAIDAATFATDAKQLLGVLATGTMQAGSTGTTAVLAAALSYADDVIIGSRIEITGGTGAGQSREITDWVSATDTATVATWVTTPDNTSTYVLRAKEAATGGGGGDGSGFTAIPWNAAWDTEVQSEVQDAIEANNLDHLVKVAVDTNFATTVHLDSVIGHIADAGGSATFDRTTDALEILGAATAPTAAAIADAVWDEATAGHVAAGSFGKLAADVLADTNELQTDWADGGRLDLLLDAATVADTYWARVDYNKDAANSQDEYTVVWYKNGTVQTSGITNAQITVVKRLDGTALVATTNMTQVGSTGVYKYDEATAEQTAGEPSIVTVTATIDSNTRTWKEVVGRDSNA